MVKLTYNTFYKNPKQLFILDGIGAVVSAVLLGIVLVRFEPLFGIPANALYLLAIFPCFFAIGDVYAYYQNLSATGFFLRGIAIINTAYCLLSFGAAWYHSDQLTYLGWAYVLLEIFIVLSLVYVEIKVANSLNTNTNVR